MKNLNQSNIFRPIVMGLSLLSTSIFFAQNTSYNIDNNPVNGNFNSAFGNNALISVGTGNDENCAFGYGALQNNAASRNAAFGVGALFSNIEGHDNVAIGNSALSYNVGNYAGNTGHFNSAVGMAALLANTDGNGNTALGYEALWSNIAGNNNTAVGYKSNIISASEGIAIGDNAIIKGGDFNLVVGTNAMVSAGQRNTVIGEGASTAAGDDNTVVGDVAWVGSGSYANTLVGHGSNVGAGCFNCSVFGAAANVPAGQVSASAFGQSTSAKGANSTALGSGAVVNADNGSALGTNVGVYHINSTGVGVSALTSAPDQIMLGSMWLNHVRTWATYICASDERFKTNIKSEDVKGLEFIKLLRPVVYNFETKKAAEYATKNLPDSVRAKYLNGTKTDIRQSGFLAQEVEAAAKKSGYDFSGVYTPKNDNDIYGLAYSEFVVPLVKGMQEQQKMIEDQAAANDALKAQIADLQKQVDNMANSKTGNTTGINQLNSLTDGFSMDQNIPNPFSNETVIKYTLTAQTKTAMINVYDLSGKQITSFPLNDKGSSSITITSEKLAAGIYIYSIVADGKIMDSKRMVVADK